ncbi:hypothetical protein NC797_11300 [Aquibacillus sp. 3ASR75-11]|uniref:Uncharacterized protein n=1 Tax=Terrihalobacillus insolitus TaxID=2950438 RepID=A0A9X4AM68_9BACI|nr:hypothetical protein [Terrihalobacillus insolitus]MDC3414592.1 hypothetical protein [Terrihalobacillus insolitus]MDC3425092.1 hypothetical protein [Terrihalobacillus insolitus]
MNKTTLIKITGGLIVAFILIFTFFKAFHYFSYKEVIEQKTPPLNVTEKKDFESLSNETVQTLQKMGFNEIGISTIKELSGDSPLNEVITYLEEFDNQQLNIKDLKSMELILNSEREEGDNLTINVKPIASFYTNSENDEYETYYTKVHFAVNVNNPMVFQSKDTFQLGFNEWYRMFGYAKLHYVSKSGEKYDEYRSTVNSSTREEMIKFDVRKSVDGTTYYLSGITGIHIIKGLNHLSLYAGYNHSKLIKNQPIKQYWATWN